MKALSGGVRFVLVTVGIIVLTSFSLDATQNFGGSQSALSLLTKQAFEVGCPLGTVEVRTGEKPFCIDIYEVSVGDGCPYNAPGTPFETKVNSEEAECRGVSMQGELPWTSVTSVQARELCAWRGMRLPTNTEWYQAALGTHANDVQCNVEGDLREAGTSNCQSASGVQDMVGNVWEWVDGEVQDGIYSDRALPAEGYVASVDQAGVATVATTTPQELMDGDYVWSSVTGVMAMMRGGFHGGGDDSGIYSLHAAVTPTFSSAAIGFRCVVDL